MWKIAVVALVVGCGGEAISDNSGAVTTPSPLETECRQHEECLQFCPPGQVCDVAVTCGFTGYCTLRCDSEENRTACLEWGGQCVLAGGNPHGTGGTEWCSR
jgi:hypothetical protein